MHGIHVAGSLFECAACAIVCIAGCWYVFESCSDTIATIACVDPLGLAHAGVIVVDPRESLPLQFECDARIGAKSPCGTLYQTNPSTLTLQLEPFRCESVCMPLICDVDVPPSLLTPLGIDIPPPPPQPASARAKDAVATAHKIILIIEREYHP
jgi:hypothetical protein